MAPIIIKHEMIWKAVKPIFDFSFHLFNRSSIETEPAVTLGPLKCKEQLAAETKKKSNPNDTKTEGETKLEGPGTYEFSHWAR